MADIDDRKFGAAIDPATREYIRWSSSRYSYGPLLCVMDCYRYIGVKRVEIPKGPRLVAEIYGSKSTSFWREYYDYSGTEVRLGVPVQNVEYLLGALPEGLALKTTGGVERLNHFLKKHLPQEVWTPKAQACWPR